LLFESEDRLATSRRLRASKAAAVMDSSGKMTQHFASSPAQALRAFGLQIALPAMLLDLNLRTG